MSITDSDKRKLIEGLAVGIGITVFGLNGPWLFQRFGLNVPEAAAAGTLAGAMICGGITHLLMRRAGRPDLVEPGQAIDLGQPRTLDVYDAPTRARWGRRQIPAPLADETAQVGIERALAGSLPDDAADIRVEVRGGKVVLRGAVRSWWKEAEAERIAFDMPGIHQVENRLEVVPSRGPSPAQN